MTEFWTDVLENVVAQWIGLLAAILLSGTLAFFFFASHRRRLIKFLGLLHPTTDLSVSVYLSNVRVRAEGARYVGGQTNPFEMSTVMAAEFLETKTLDRMLDDGLLRYVPEPLQKRLTRWSKTCSPIARFYEASPADPAHVPGNTLILIGGREFNALTAHFMAQPGALMGFVGEQCSSTHRSHVEILSGKASGQIIRPHSETMDLAIIQKQVLPGEHRIILHAAGNGSSGTRAAVRFLVERWPELYRKYGTDPFAICIQCERRAVNPSGYLHHNVLRTIPED